MLYGEDGIEESDEEGDRPRWKMLQGPVGIPLGPGALPSLRPLMAS